jgi:hypothetical protein
MLRGKIVLMILFIRSYEDPGLSRLFWGVVVFRHHMIIGIEMLSQWGHPSIVDRILKSNSQCIALPFYFI